MRKLLIITTSLAAIAAFQATAAQGEAQATVAAPAAVQAAGGGFNGPTSVPLVTIAEARKLGDDAPVRVRGHILRSLGDDRYELKDATGLVKVEIDQEVWQGREVKPSDLVEISGEVDKDLWKTGLEAESLVLVP